MRLFLQFFALVFIVMSANAQDPQLDTVIVDRGVLLDFVPEEAFFVVAFDDKISVRLPAVIIPPLRKDPTSSNAGMWWVGAELRVPVGSQVMRSFGFAHGKEDRVKLLPLEAMDLRSGQHFWGSNDKLREYLLQRKEGLTLERRKLKQQDLQLARLRSDAEVIGNFGRIIDTKEELSRTKQGSQNLDRDMAATERFIKLASTYAAPLNAVGREQQLTGQIAELAGAAKRAERGELSRRWSNDQELKRRMQVLEEARESDLADLGDELERLKAEREALEKGM